MASWPPLLPLLITASLAAAPAWAESDWQLWIEQQGGTSPLQRLVNARLGELSVSSAPTDGRMSGFPRLELGAGVGLLCDTGFGIHTALADLDQHCLLARIDAGRWSLSQVDALTLGSTFALERGQAPLELHLGVDWLRTGPGSPSSTWDGSWVPPALRLQPMLGEGGVDGIGLAAGFTFWTPSPAWFRVIGRNGRFEGALGDANARPLLWNVQSLSLGAGVGTFSGNLTGRRTRVPSLDRSWFDLDLGVTWRTPWSASLTIGARNLLSPAEAIAPDLGRADEKPAEARIPYVRYEQDL